VNSGQYLHFVRPGCGYTSAIWPAPDGTGLPVIPTPGTVLPPCCAASVTSSPHAAVAPTRTPICISSPEQYQIQSALAELLTRLTCIQEMMAIVTVNYEGFPQFFLANAGVQWLHFKFSYFSEKPTVQLAQSRGLGYQCLCCTYKTLGKISYIN
jgi:hypothetical protein